MFPFICSPFPPLFLAADVAALVPNSVLTVCFYTMILVQTDFHCWMLQGNYEIPSILLLVLI